jgi:O-antigen ligase
MVNILDFFSNLWQKIKFETKNNPIFCAILLVLLSIPLSYALNSICLGFFILITIITIKKRNLVFSSTLFLPIFLYILMLFSVFWSIDKENTITSLLKEIPLLIIPICFLSFKTFPEETKTKIIEYYSHGIFMFCCFYFIKATIRFLITQDLNVFFYHELVTKDVNAIHVSVYVAIAFFYFFTKSSKKTFDFIAISFLLLFVFLLSSKNIIVVFIGLILIYHLFYSKLSKQLRLKNLLVFITIIISFSFIGQIKNRFKTEYETMMTDSTVNDVISKGDGIVYNVSIKQAWTNEKFKPNDFFPGTAFRVYQFRIFIEMLKENNIFWNGFGLNASYKKIEEKGIFYNLYLGDKSTKNEGYQTKNFHNQYVQNFAELGVFGFMILVIMLFVNLKNGIQNKDFIHIAFALLMISLFLTESFLWRQRGVVFFTMMYCILNSKSISKTVI